MRIRPEEVVSKSFTLGLSRVEHRVTSDIGANGWANDRHSRD